MSAETATPGDAVAATAGRDDALEELRGGLSALLAAERRLRSHDRGPGELTHAHIRSLHALADGELTAGQLARSAELNPASVTAMLDHLEAAGIVGRRRSQSDRRVCLVALTDEGRALLAQKTTAWRAMWSQRLAGYEEAELRAAGRVLHEITELLDSITRPTGSPDG